MPITACSILDAQTGWQISFASSGIRHKENRCNYNWKKNSRHCHILDCKNKVRINSPSGRCTDHQLHTADLLLEISCRPHHGTTKIPAHAEIIEQLIAWAATRNYQIDQFFESLSFSLLGNIPDATILDGKCTLVRTPPSLMDLIERHMMPVINQFFPEGNSSSYQMLETQNGKFPVRVLSIILAGLVLCEESNRGDRWFCRNIISDESRTTQMGGAMPIAYFAIRRFKWGVEMGGNILKNII